MKSRAERSIEALTWASVVIWLGFSLIMHLLDYAWLVLMVLGIILLSSAIYQRSRGWHTSLMIWIGGVWMAIFSVIEVTNEIVAALSTDGEGLHIDLLVYLGIALISMGLAVVLRHIQPPSLAQRSAEPPSVRDSQGYIPSVIPQRVADDYSSGYFPPDSATQSQGAWAAPDQQITAPRPRTDPAAPRPTGQYAAAQHTAGRRARPANTTSWSQTGAQPRPANRRARPAPRADTPSDLEARVEDIIRRSRQRRGLDSGDDLPY